MGNSPPQLRIVNMRTQAWQLRLIQLLAVAGLLLAFYLWLFHEGQLIAVCSGSGWDDCGQVSGPDAPYASLGPIPVAAIGFVGYLGIFLTIWLQDWIPALRGYIVELMLGLIGLALLFTLGLTALEAFVIRAFCRYCLVSAAIIVVMFGLALSLARGRTGAPEA